MCAVFFGGERAHLQGLAECHDGFVVAPRRPQAQGDLHMGFPGILRVAGHVLELFARLVEHLGVLEHTTAFIVVDVRTSVVPCLNPPIRHAGTRRQILADGEGSKNNTPRSIHAGPTNQAFTWSTRGSTGGKRRQVGRKGTRHGRPAVVRNQCSVERRRDPIGSKAR